MRGLVRRVRARRRARRAPPPAFATCLERALRPDGVVTLRLSALESSGAAPARTPGLFVPTHLAAARAARANEE